MNIAICLYGQPRYYKLGYKNINKLIMKNPNHSFETFFHCWCANDIIFDKSPWRAINKKELYIEDETKVKSDLLNLYKPKAYKFEEPIKKFDLEKLNIKELLAYKTTKDRLRNNIHNTLSQMYSRNTVRNILNNYIENNEKKYDMVLMIRFDYKKEICINFDKINKEYTYVAGETYPKYLIPDNIILSPLNVFLKWFNLYENLNIMDNIEICNKFKKIKENYILNMEEIILANYLYYFDLNKVIYDINIKIGLRN